jgi:hypothetical protein
MEEEQRRNPTGKSWGVLGILAVFFGAWFFSKLRAPFKNSSDPQHPHHSTEKQTCINQKGPVNVVIIPSPEQVTAETKKERREDKKFRIERISALILLAYAVTTFLLWWDTRHNFMADERPWMGAIEAGNLTITGSEISFPVNIGVTGKTPARDVRAVFRLDKVDEGKPLGLNPFHVPQNKATNFLVHGMMFPGQAAPLTVYRIDEDGHHIPFNQTELTQLQTGKAFVIIYGDIVYQDIFGSKHWTQFCTWKIMKPGDYHAAECSEHNNAD